MAKMNELSGWGLLGLIYGYPDCCIEAFTRDRQKLAEESPLLGTGFCPCQECHDTKSVAELLGEINTNRAVPWEFSQEIHATESSFLGCDPADAPLLMYDVLKEFDELEVNRELFKACREFVKIEEVELNCYKFLPRGERKSEAIYFFAPKGKKSGGQPLLYGGEVHVSGVTKAFYRVSNPVCEQKALELRTQYPALYNNRVARLDVAGLTQYLTELSKG